MTTPYEQTVERQIKAASPHLSAWVGANAGSGKTRILTNRVARLLLTNVAPSRILCITYTKAAAAEMAERLYTLLGDWALMDDKRLAEKLQELEGDKIQRRSGIELSKARRLFAQALETPGGLKIQTIHAFCSHVLKRFPLEANVPPGFGEIEEGEASALIDQALETVANDANTDSTLAEALYHLSSVVSAHNIGGFLKDFVRRRQNYEAMLQYWGSNSAMLAQLSEELDISEHTTHKEIIEETLKHFPTHTILETANTLKSGTKTDIKNAETLTSAAQAHDASTKFNHLCDYFLNKDQTPRKNLVYNEVQKKHPLLNDYLIAVQEQVIKGILRINASNIYHDTRCLLLVGEKLSAAYANLKKTRSVLDFDDLIIATRRLFECGQHATKWVMYKLDQGIDHILIDEAQDTSPSQWDVIEKPLTEFFSDIGTRNRKRTLFVVGDEKQSIYSFQGADASLFGEKSQSLGKKISTAAQYHNIPLTLSFRSTAPVLNFVDEVFTDKSSMEGMGETEKLQHGINRTGEAGLVELWPTTPKPEKPKTNPWDAPLDTISVDNPLNQLCDYIATTINSWLDTEILESQNRTIIPGDIIILVQRRGALFRQMIKSLTQHHVPVAGADRLKLLSEIVIQDILSYGRCLLLPEDDLSLAETLKSPFFNLDDEDLFALAYGRTGSLWKTLRKRHHEKPLWEQAYEEISDARKIALKNGAYDFYSWLLDQNTEQISEQTGRQRIYARLGAVSTDSLNAFLQLALDYESSNPRNLQGFMSWFEDNAHMIKRELDQTDDAVRIMTVHGAKGLEGNIVFLLDAHEKPNAKNIGNLFQIPAENTIDPIPTVPAFVRSKNFHVEATTAALDEAKRKNFEEYRRLFYVAATRAKDRLYICGLDTGTQKKQDLFYNNDSWHTLSQKGMERLRKRESLVTAIDTIPWDGEGWRFSCPQTKSLQKTDKTADIDNTIKTPPSWLRKKCAQEVPTKQLTPSSLADYHEDQASMNTLLADNFSSNIPTAYSPLEQESKFIRGRALHRLLEILPEYPKAKRPELADRLLENLTPQISSDIRSSWREEVFTILDHPEFTAVFAQDSRAEVNIGGTPVGARENIIINGQIDRLSVNAEEVLIVDYKTNQPPPQYEEDVADAYLAQMAAYRGLIQPLYPNKKIKTGLIWTYEAKLMVLSDKLLDHAFSRFLT